MFYLLVVWSQADPLISAPHGSGAVESPFAYYQHIPFKADLRQHWTLSAQAGATAVGNVAHGVQATGATAVASAAQAAAGRRHLLQSPAVVHPISQMSHLPWHN